MGLRVQGFAHKEKNSPTLVNTGFTKNGESNEK